MVLTKFACSFENFGDIKKGWWIPFWDFCENSCAHRKKRESLEQKFANLSVHERRKSDETQAQLIVDFHNRFVEN